MVFRPLTTSNSQQANYGQVNDMMRRLDKEQTTKTYKQAGGNAIVEGRLPYSGGYGSMYFDSDNVPRIIIGILPDGTTGIVATKYGVSALDVFN
jgi:hypothetical protein